MRGNLEELIRFLANMPINLGKLERAAENILDADSEESKLVSLVNANVAHLQGCLPPALQLPLQMMKQDAYRALEWLDDSDFLEISQRLRETAGKAGEATREAVEGAFADRAKKDLIIAELFEVMGKAGQAHPMLRALAFTELLHYSKLPPAVQAEALKLEFPSTESLLYWDGL